MFSTETCVPMTARLVEMSGDMEGAQAGWQGCGPNGSCRFLFPSMPRGLWDVVGRTMGVHSGGTYLGVGSKDGWGGGGRAPRALLTFAILSLIPGSVRRGQEVSVAQAVRSAAVIGKCHQSSRRQPRLELRGCCGYCSCRGKLQIPPPPPASLWPPPPLLWRSSPPPAQEGLCRKRRIGKDQGVAQACPASPFASHTPPSFHLPASPCPLRLLLD